MALERFSDIAQPANLDAMWKIIEQKTGRARADIQVDAALEDTEWLADRRRENAEHRRNMSRMLSRIPEIYMNAALDDYRYREGNSRAINDAKRVMLSDGRLGLGLYGEPGVGKTMLAAIVANAAIAHGRLTIFMSVRRMLDTIKDTYNPANSQAEQFATELKLIKRYASIDTLVLNDLGKEPLTKWSVEMLFAIFDDRWEQGRKTIVTANLNWPDLLKRYSSPMPALDESPGPAMMDRLAGMTEMPWIEIRGESQRWGV